MSTTTTPNMNLIVPTVGQEPGPTYATDVNNSLMIIDQHDHSNGSGVQITPAGLNINSALVMNSNLLTFVGGITLQAQLSTPGINTVYESGVDLYFVDGLGNNIQITANGGVAGTSGSISNLVPPASAAYVSGSQTFVWQSGVNIAANMDFGAAIMRNLTPNSTFALTLQPPAALSNDYTLTLPVVPGSTLPVLLNNSGTFSTGTISGAQISSATITGSNIAAATIAGSNIAALTITGANIAASTVTTDKLGPLTIFQTSGSGSFSTSSTSAVQITNMSVVVTSYGSPVWVGLVPDGNTNAGSGTFTPPIQGIIFQIRKNGSTITHWGQQPNVVTSNSSGGITTTSTAVIPQMANSIFTIDSSPTGSDTYTCWMAVFSAGGTATITDVKLVAYEL